MAPNIHTLNNISNPQPQPQTFKDRYCPGMRSCWTFNPAKFNPVNRDRDDTIRRVCMCLTLGVHTGLDILSLFMLTISFNIIGLLVKTILSLIGFFFMVWCLTTIGDAQGERIVIGKTVGRWYFDVFLMFCAFVYSAAFLGFLFGMGGLSGLVIGLMPLPTWILIFLVAWVATWDSSGVSLA